MSDCILQGKFQRMTAFVMTRRGNSAVDQVHGSLADNASRLTVAVAVDLAAGWICCCRGDFSQPQSLAVGDGDMTVNTSEDCRVVACNNIKALSRGKLSGLP